MRYEKIKRFLVDIPFVGYVLRMINSVISAPQEKDKLSVTIGEITGTIENNQKLINSFGDELSKYSHRINVASNKSDELQKQVAQLKRRPSEEITHSDIRNKDALFADNHLLDEFYTAFEDRFKNTELTYELYSIYTDLFRNSPIDFKVNPVLDVGCGRGEFLKYMKDLDIQAEGIDINTDMVKRAHEAGYSVISGDAIKHLEDSDMQKYGAITGFHLIEHIPFQGLLELFNAAYGSLVDDGFVLFETPNPENIVVAGHSFYFDPSHIKPLPPALMAFALEFSGFRKVEIIRSYPVKKKKPVASMTDEVFKAIYGPRNYAVIGYK